MKQFLFLIGMFVVGGVGSLIEPFWAVLLYYTLAVLRPQYLWEWALPTGWRWSLYAAVITVISVVIHMSRLVAKGRSNLVATLMMIYGALLLASIVTAHDPATAQHWGVEYGKILFLAMIASVVISHLWQIQAMAVMIMITLGYMAWEVNYLYFFNSRLDIYHHGYGGLDNNGAGLLLAMGIPFAFCFVVSAKYLWQRAASCFLGLAMLHALLMSYSRGAMLSIAAGIIWLVIHYRSRLNAVVLTVLLCMVVSVMAGQEIRQRFWSATDFRADKSAHARLDSWDAAWAIAWDHPITGQGIRNSNQYTRNYGADKHGRTIHSQYLQIAADSGFPALIVYVLMLAVSLNHLAHARRRCIGWLADQRSDLVSDSDRRRVYQLEHVALACQASLIIFAFDGVFLSLEVFELPWLVIVLAGVMPSALERYLVHLEKDRHAMRHDDNVLHPPPRPGWIKPKPATGIGWSPQGGVSS